MSSEKKGCVFLLCGLTTVVLIIFSLGEMPKHSQARKSPSCQFYSSSFPKRGAWENCPAINRSDYTLQITPSSLTWLTKSFGEGHSQIIFSFSMQTRVTLVYSKIVTIRQSRCDLGLIWRQLNASSDLSSSLERLIRLVFAPFFSSPRRWRVETIRKCSLPFCGWPANNCQRFDRIRDGMYCGRIWWTI